MRLKLWYFINKYAILKKLFFWIFPLLGLNVAKAETIYQCAACPSGLSTNPGAIGAGACFNPVTKPGPSVIFNGTGNYSGTLQPGWYRISLRGANGSGTGWKTGDRYCAASHNECTGWGEAPCLQKNNEYCEGSSSCYVVNGGTSNAYCYGGCTFVPANSICVQYGDKPCISSSPVCDRYDNGSSCQGNGGIGGQTYYVFYVTSTANYSFTYNGGSPKLVVTESGRATRTFLAGKGGNGYANKSGVNWSCGNGGNGTSNSASGLFSSMDRSSGNYDGLGSAGGKLTKL